MTTLADPTLAEALIGSAVAVAALIGGLAARTSHRHRMVRRGRRWRDDLGG